MSIATSPDLELSKELTTFREPIRRYIQSIVRNAEEAEDLAQETFVRALESLEGLEDRSSAGSWLYRIATNVSHDHFRRSAAKKRTPPGEEPADVAELVADPGPRLDKVLEQAEMGTCVQNYLARLSDTYRAVILLHDVEGMTNAEVAEMLDISLSTAKIRLHRARLRLAAALEEGCSFSRDERSVLVCDPKTE